MERYVYCLFHLATRGDYLLCVHIDSYKEVATGLTNHAEAIEIHYDPSKISYNDLLEVLWRNIDPTDGSGQFVDRGKQYRPAIFYHNKDQKLFLYRLIWRFQEQFGIIFPP